MKPLIRYTIILTQDTIFVKDLKIDTITLNFYILINYN